MVNGKLLMVNEIFRFSQNDTTFSHLERSERSVQYSQNG